MKKIHLDAYGEHNNAMKQDMRERLIGLDRKYETYTNIINCIQISIIVFAATSTFIQASSETMQITQFIFFNKCEKSSLFIIIF